MTRVSNFIYCMGLDNRHENVNALGVLSAITPDYLPGGFSFAIICSVLDLEEGKHTFELKFMNPDGNETVNINGEFDFMMPANCNLPKEHCGINIGLQIQNVVFEKAGAYKTIVSIDGTQCGEYEIFVKGKNEPK